MREADFFLKQFDTAPAISGVLVDPSDGVSPMNLTGASIRFNIKPANGGGTVGGGVASIVGDPTNGSVSYQWQPADVAVAGNFSAEWIVTLPGGREMTWPNDRYMRIDIEARLDPADSPAPPAPLVGTVTGVIFSLDSVNTTGVRLATFDASALAEGSVAFVSTIKAAFDLVQAALPTNTNVVAAFNKAGFQWHRRIVQVPFWQAQATWVIDPTNQTGLANDENIGNGGAPLLTLREHATRLAGAIIDQYTQITVMGDQQAGDEAKYTFWTSNNAFVEFDGVPTAIYSSTVTSFTLCTVNNTTAATDDSQLVDTAVPGGSWTAAGALAKGVIIKRTTSNAVYAFALKDLGSHALRVNIPADPNDFTLAATFSPGDSYQLLRLPKLLNASFTDPAALGIMFNLFDMRVQNFFDYEVRWLTNCYISVAEFGVGGFYEHVCFDTGGMVFEGGGNLGDTSLVNACFKGSGASRYSFEDLTSTNWEGNVVTFQGACMIAEDTNLNCAQVNVYDCTDSQAALWANTNARIHMLGVVSGKGNTCKLLRASGGSIVYSSGPMANGFVYRLASTTDPAPLAAGVVTSATQIPLTGGGNGVFQFDTA